VTFSNASQAINASLPGAHREFKAPHSPRVTSETLKSQAASQLKPQAMELKPQAMELKPQAMELKPQAMELKLEPKSSQPRGVACLACEEPWDSTCGDRRVPSWRCCYRFQAARHSRASRTLGRSRRSAVGLACVSRRKPLSTQDHASWADRSRFGVIGRAGSGRTLRCGFARLGPVDSAVARRWRPNRLPRARR